MILPSSLFKFKYKNLTAGYDFFLFHINSGSDFKVKGERSEAAIVVDDDDLSWQVCIRNVINCLWKNIFFLAIALSQQFSSSIYKLKIKV